MLTLRRNRPRRNYFRRVQLSRYRSRPFQNPYFQSKPKRKLWPWAAAGLGLGGLVAGVSFFLTSPVFAISSVRVEGAESINPKDIRQVVTDYLAEPALVFFHANNRFLFREEELRDRLSKRFAFDQLSIQAKPPEVDVSVKEKISTFLWKNDAHTYLIDEQGIVIREITDAERETLVHPPPVQGPVLSGESLDTAPKFFTFVDAAPAAIEIGKPVLTSEIVTRALDFAKRLDAMNIAVDRFVLDRTVGTWMRAVTVAGYDILFDPSLDVEQQADNLVIVLRDKIPDPTKLQYIDLRFDDHIYFK